MGSDGDVDMMDADLMAGLMSRLGGDAVEAESSPELDADAEAQAVAEASEVVSEDAAQAVSQTEVLRAALEADEFDEEEEEEEEAGLEEQVIPEGVVQAAPVGLEGVDEEESEEEYDPFA